tara:strand:- start:304 stop:1290 length:987 start_codon:yes stop_codon:yes gene_type:complete
MYPSFNVNLGPIKLSYIINLLSPREIVGLQGQSEFSDFVGVNNLQDLDNSISFVYENFNQINILPKKGNFIVSKRVKDKFLDFENLIIVDNVHEAVAKLSSIFYRDIGDADINLEQDIIFGNNCTISSNAIIKKGVNIGNDSIIKDGVVINNNCIIGNNVLIEENTVISNVIIGDNVKIGRNTSIGQPGFGFALSDSCNHKIYHLGRVILHSNVNIGSNCCIDRGSFGDTIIGENTFFDNLCHVAHNVIVGNNCVFAAMAGIAGSSKIGDSVIAGGQVGIAGHLNVGNNVLIAAKSAVLKNIDENSSVMGNPAIDKYKYIRKYKKLYG